MSCRSWRAIFFSCCRACCGKVGFWRRSVMRGMILWKCLARVVRCRLMVSLLAWVCISAP